MVTNNYYGTSYHGTAYHGTFYHSGLNGAGQTGFAGTLAGKKNLWLLAKQAKEDEMRQEDDEIVQILKTVVEHIESGDE